ncbi:MAG: plasmid mobilization protein [Oscillospiraceae bacterium]
MSPEEKALFDSLAAVSGLTKQDYLISRALQKDIIVENSPRVYKALKDKLGEVLAELRRISEGTVSEELLETIRFIAAILGEMNGGEG